MIRPSARASTLDVVRQSQCSRNAVMARVTSTRTQAAPAALSANMPKVTPVLKPSRRFSTGSTVMPPL